MKKFHFSNTLTTHADIHMHTHSLLLIGEYDISMEGLDHEQCLTERARPLTQHLVRLHGDDSAKGKDERVDVLHIEVVCGNCI